MGLQVEHPWALLLLLPCAALVWAAWTTTGRLAGGRKAAAVAVRTVVLLLLVALVAGVVPYTEHERRDVVFVADRSASLGGEARLEAWIAEAIAAKGERDRAAVVSFGLSAAVERALSEDAADGFAMRAAINDAFSNAAGGMQLAETLLEGGGRIVLLSDGEENAGDLLRQGKRLQQMGVEVDVVPFPQAERKDAALEALNVQSTLKQGEKFTFELAVTSTFAGEAELRLFEDETELTRTFVTLERGENRFALQSVAVKPGFHRYRAELYAAGDERAENNAAYAFSRVDGPPAVLIVEGQPDSSGNIAQALESSLIPYAVAAPEQLPRELADYARYDSVILNNVPATRLAGRTMDNLAAAVSDFGIGMVMIGGDNSYGLGGYFQTPIERALPVYMDLQGKRQIPSLGLILVIDRSGSMDGGKLELAKEAALRTVELLRDQDTVGVVAFDDTPWWVVEPAKLTDRDAVMSAIRGIQPAGGTEIYPAVSAALTRMLEVDAQRKHIILLTDGQSAGGGDYAGLTGEMVRNQITMSSVAVGDGADTALLKRLADDARGRYYFTNDQSTIPAIFSREAVMMSRTYIVENRFVPAIGRAGEWTELLAGGMPPIHAYVATTAKETAETALVAPMGDPLLARWQYGSGRTVAWTSDLTGKWARDWIGWAALPDVLAQWVKWTFPQFASEPYEVRAALEDGQAKLRITAAGDSMRTNLQAVVTGERGERFELSPMPNAPGDYSAAMPATGPGVYLVRIDEKPPEGGADAPADGTTDGEGAGGATAGFVIPYSPEYRLSGGGGSERLAQLAELTGGRMLSPDRPEEAFRGALAASRDTIDATRALLIAALLLWLIDIALRRISIPWSRLAAKLAGLLPRRRAAAGEAGAAGGSPALARLRRRTREAGAFYAGAQDGARGGERAAPAPGASAAAPQQLATPQGSAASPAGASAPAAREAPPRPAAGGAHAAGAEPARPDGRPASSAPAAAPDAPAASGRADEPPGGPPDGPPDAAGKMNRLLAARNRGRR